MKEKQIWKKATVAFKLNTDKVSFEIIHNLNQHNYSLDVVVQHWIARTEKYTVQSLVDYINSKTHMTECFAMTVEMYENTKSEL